MISYHAGAQPSARIGLGVIGAGGRGTLLMKTFCQDAGVRVGAVCDVFAPNLERALEAGRGPAGGAPKGYRNYRQLLDDRDINAVVIATPEHWHHRMVLDALAAGKDIYVEKPLCQTPQQGVELVDAGKRSRCIAQVGMQRRSYDLYLKAREVIAAGKLGAVRMVRGWWLNNHVNAAAPAKLEGTLDWEQWQGPAPHRPFDPNRFRNWRLFSDYAGGILADQGAHVFDGIHLLMAAGFPVAVNATAARPHKPGVDTPEAVVAAAEYAEDFVGIFTINYAAMHYKTRNDQLNQLDGDKARMDVSREEARVFIEGREETPEITLRSERGFGYATDLHVQNFLECTRSRKQPAAPLELGFQATLVPQLANLSLRQGRRIRWNSAARRPE